MTKTAASFFLVQSSLKTYVIFHRDWSRTKYSGENLKEYEDDINCMIAAVDKRFSVLAISLTDVNTNRK